MPSHSSLFSLICPLELPQLQEMTAASAEEWFRLNDRAKMPETRAEQAAIVAYVLSDLPAK